jgi:peptidoglycan/xylan/chitin deacetylase (PgdA/CDA1 family)
LSPAPTASDWEAAARAATDELPAAARQPLDRLPAAVLGEGQFGPHHWQLSGSRRLYYRLKPLVPRPLVRRLRRAGRERALRGFPLNWPVEDRWRRFLWAAAVGAMERAGLAEMSFIGLWPSGAGWALVLTHDVEGMEGQRFAAAVADLEQGLGFRSSFNFVASRYRLDRGLIADLRRRGFEVGVHGFRHDGHEYDSRTEFEAAAAHVNARLHELGAVGYRAPLTHRNPIWMQALEIEYDLSFFDTDPFEPIPGGTMSLWPFFCGRFIELPYTLAQDSTLSFVLDDPTPGPWLEKTRYLASWHGMALLNTHPDYLRRRPELDRYRGFLEGVGELGRRWHALPGEAAAWWRVRASAPAEAVVWRLGQDGQVHLPSGPAALTASPVLPASTDEPAPA